MVLNMDQRCAYAAKPFVPDLISQSWIGHAPQSLGQVMVSTRGQESRRITKGCYADLREEETTARYPWEMIPAATSGKDNRTISWNKRRTIQLHREIAKKELKTLSLLCLRFQVTLIIFQVSVTPATTFAR